MVSKTLLKTYDVDMYSMPLLRTYLLCTLFIASPLFAAKTHTKMRSFSEPLQLEKIEEIRIPPTVKYKGVSLRIKNLGTGQFVIVRLDSFDQTLPVSTLSKLVSSKKEMFLPEFSILQKTDETNSQRALPQALLVQKRDMAPALALSKSTKKRRSQTKLIWKRIGYRVKKNSKTNAWKLVLAENLYTKFLTAEQALERRKVQGSAATSKLFDIGWRSLEISKFDLALQAFSRLLKKTPNLSQEQKSQANLGWAVATFSQDGCVENINDFLLEADRDPENQSDVSYYRALCLLEEEKFQEAENSFRALTDSNHQEYGESSTFYLGVIAEKQGRLSDAETAYLDVIDFASDESILSLAKERLSFVKYLQRRYALTDSIISGGVGLTGAYDTNAVALPQDLSPASYGLSKQSASYLSSLMFFTLTPPWSPKWSQQLNYNFFVTHYLDESLVADYDSMVHDLGTTFNFSTSSTLSHTLSLAFTTIRVGSWGASYEALRSHGLTYQLRQIILDKRNQAKRLYDFSLKFSNVLLISDVANPVFNPGAEGLALEVKISEVDTPRHTYGPEFEIEYRPSRGTEVSSGKLRFGGFWDYQFSKRPMYVTQEANFTYKDYYQSSGDRKDYQLNYIGALGWKIADGLDFKLQYKGLLNVSSLPSSYQYSAHNFNATLSVYF